MRFKWIKVGLGGLIAAIFVLLNVSALQSAQASTLQDGTYTVPVTVNMNKNGSASTADGDSAAQTYFDRTATVKIDKGTYQVTINTQDPKKYMTSVTVDGQSALNSNNVSFDLTAPTPNVEVTFKIHVTLPNGKTMDMTEVAWFVFKWDEAKLVSGSAPTTSSTSSNSSASVTSSDPTAAASDADTASAAPSSANTSSATTKSQSSTTSSTTAPTKAATAKTATTKATATKAALTTDGWTYEVLQADNNKVSAANKFYTHAAKITKVGNQYQVQLTVKYAKNSGMQARGFKPLTTNGQAAQNVHYSTSGNDYVVTYTFNVNKLSELTHLITGTVHVAVPTVGINQDFTVRFKFNHQGSATAATDTAKATPNAVSHHVTTTNGTAGDTTNNRRRGNLPQTNEQPAILATVFGLITLLAVSGAVMISKKVAK